MQLQDFRQIYFFSNHIKKEISRNNSKEDMYSLLHRYTYYLCNILDIMTGGKSFNLQVILRMPQTDKTLLVLPPHFKNFVLSP